MHQHPAHLREFHEGIHHLFRLPRGRQDIDVVHRLLPPPDAAGNLDPIDGRRLPDLPDDLLGERPHPAEGAALVPAPDGLDPLEDILFGLFLNARQAGEFPRPREGFELFDARDVPLLVEHLHRFRSEAGHAQKLEHPRGKLRLQGLMLGDLPGRRVFADLCRQVLADPRDRLQLLLGERGDILREPVDVLGGPMVRPDPKDVFPLELEELADLLKDFRDLLVFHSAFGPARS